MSNPEQNTPLTDEAYLLIRERVAEYIKPESVDDVMNRPIPFFDGVTLREVAAEDHHLAEKMVEAMFDWGDTQGA